VRSRQHQDRIAPPTFKSNQQAETMPRVSKRAKVITSLSLVYDNRLKHRAIRLLNDDEDSLEDLKDLATGSCLSKISKSRYLYQSTKYRKSPAVGRFKTDLMEEAERDSESEVVEVRVTCHGCLMMSFFRSNVFPGKALKLSYLSSKIMRYSNRRQRR
jgi:hypothetical protein